MFVEMVCKDSRDLRRALCEVFWCSLWFRLARRVLPRNSRHLRHLLYLMHPMDVARYLCPGAFSGVIAPVHDRIALNLYGFYYGEVDVPVAQVDVPIRTTTFLTITPSYLYYEIPPSGLNKSAEHAPGFTDTFEENQLRIDGTMKFSIRGFEISDRNMYVRRFRPTDEINRYRHRIGIAHPLAVNGRMWKAFATL